MNGKKSEKIQPKSSKKKITITILLSLVALLVVWRIVTTINAEPAKFIDECSYEALLKREGKPSHFCDDPAQSTNHRKKMDDL